MKTPEGTSSIDLDRRRFLGLAAMSQSANETVPNAAPAPSSTRMLFDPFPIII